MERGTWIILSNSGGELDRVFAGELTDLNVAVYDAIINQHWMLAPGDTISFVEGESENG